MADKSKKDCFVVGPIGASDSEVRIHADWLLEEIISPVMERLPEFVVHRADKMSQPGLIDTQVITHLLNDDLVIGDLTTLNPNAFYEIGIRHMVQKPIVHMHLAGEKIPFDISLYRSVEFSLKRPSDIKAARQALEQAITAVLASDYKVDNPVTHARGVVKIEEYATESQRVILDEMKGLREKVAELERLLDPKPIVSGMRTLSNKDLYPATKSLLSAAEKLTPEEQTTLLDLIERMRERGATNMRVKLGPTTVYRDE